MFRAAPLNCRCRFSVVPQNQAEAVLSLTKSRKFPEPRDSSNWLSTRPIKQLSFGPLFAFTPSEMTLRIDISDERDRVVFTLTGRIQAEQVAELQALLKSDLPGHSLVLDLKEVKLVDRDAVRFLGEIEAQGVRLRNCSAFVREWISREREGMQLGKSRNEQV